MSVVGIDFGYQTCYVAVARQGGVETVANEYSDRLTPSCVSFGEKERAVGVAAKNQIVTNRKNTIWGWKKFLGRPFNDPQVQQELPKLSYDVVEGPEGSTGIQVQYLGESQVFSPEQITATMLGKLRDVASAALSTKVVDCVVSVPSYFTDIERRALLDAGQVAGLNILALINDTTASALSYGIYKQDLPEESDKPRVVVFVDMGHSSLQVAACAFNKGKLKVLAKVNDPNLGGRDFDELIANHIADEFKKTYKLDVRSNGRAWLRLLQESEKLKKLMSQNTSAVPMNIECFMEDKDVTYSMKRKDMETLAESLLVRVEATLKEILTAAKVSPDDLFGVEIIGGSTRIPAVKELVKSVFGKEPFTTLNADEAVARGCALQCAILSPVFRVREFSITDAQPYSVTLKWTGGGLEEADNDMEVFTQYHPIPFSKMLTFYRKEPFALQAVYTHPPNVPVSQPLLGKFVISKIVPDAATGENSKVKVKVRVNANGVFSITEASMSEKVESAPEPEASDSATKNGPTSMDTAPPAGADQPKTEGGDKMDVDQGPPTPQPGDQQQPPINGQTAPAAGDESTAGVEKMDEDKPDKGGKKKVKVRWIDLPVTPYVPQMTKDKIQLLFEKEVQMIAQDRQEKERADSKNAVEEYVLEMRKHLSDKYEPFVREEDKEKFMALLTSTEDWLYDEGEDTQKSIYVEKLVQMRKVGDPIVKRYNEAMDRPLAFDELGLALQLVRKALDAYHQQDEKYSHLEPADIEKVEKCVAEKAAWYEQKLKDIDSQSTYDDPVVLASQIRTEKKLLDSTCTPILTKPKPKPKQEPPKPEAAPQTNGPAEGKGDTSETGADKPQEAQPDAEKPSAMDLD